LDDACSADGDKSRRGVAFASDVAVTMAKKVASERILETNQVGMRRVFRTNSSRWPFWLLIVAWVCANSPQAATYALLTWMAEARSFTHQHRLMADVASLLGEKDAPVALAKADVPGPEKPTPMVPADAVLKKFPLSTETASGVVAPSRRPDRLRFVAIGGADWLRPPPPHGPPRLETIT
jgi:hypothetical protein